jgi:hypothetical protein
VTFDGRLSVVALSTFALAASVGSVVAVQAARRRRDDKSAAGYAHTIFRLRMLPATVGLAAMVQGALSFLVFEPRREQEAVGVLLTILAATGIALYGVALARWIRVTLATNRVIRGWMRTATPLEIIGMSAPAYAIDATFPVVAVVGIFRRRIVVARQVLAACSPAELAAIWAHERWHLTHHDNVRRALMACLPDPLSMTDAGERLAARWHDANELAADDSAGEIGPTGRCDLAAALLNVARLVPAGASATLLPASALYRGEDLGRRVRRLVGSTAPSPRARASRLHRMAIAFALLVAAGLALHGMHAVVEAAVTYLP